MQHIELGKLGEDLAVRHLQSNHYKILDRNYTWKKSEVDVICQKDDQLIVVEVKTRNTGAFGEPYEAVSRSKQRQIIKVTNEYIREHDLDLDVRFDVISIINNQYRTSIEHIENAFYPTL